MGGEYDKKDVKDRIVHHKPIHLFCKNKRQHYEQWTVLSMGSNVVLDSLLLYGQKALKHAFFKIFTQQEYPNPHYHYVNRSESVSYSCISLTL